MMSKHRLWVIVAIVMAGLGAVPLADHLALVADGYTIPPDSLAESVEVGSKTPLAQLKCGPTTLPCPVAPGMVNLCTMATNAVSCLLPSTNCYNCALPVNYLACQPTGIICIPDNSGVGPCGFSRQAACVWTWITWPVIGTCTCPGLPPLLGPSPCPESNCT
jgi:hypothetical protein